jgi:cation:H+ antiporter
MDAWTLILFFAGLVLLLLGGEFLVRGASRLALSAGVSALAIGLTVVAFGTSAPELAVSVRGALAGQADVALGNVVGSNIFNVLVILGISALVAPIVVKRRLLWVDVPLLIAVSGVTWYLAADGRVSRLDGLLLFGGVVVYTVVALIDGRRAARADVAAAAAAAAASAPEAVPVRPAAPPVRGSRLVDVAFIVAGLAALVVGSGWLVDGAVAMARALGFSELVIGLTIVAAGTSLPEVATSVIAVARGERDIAVGNVIGSSLFNLLAVLGGTAAVTPEGVAVSTAALAFDIPVMVATAVACLPIFATGHRISRGEGLLFLSYYVAYAAYLILAATEHDALPLMSWTMLLAALPLTVVGIAVSVVRSLRGRSAPPRAEPPTRPAS